MFFRHEVLQNFSLFSPRIKGLSMTMLGAFCFALVPIWVRFIEGYSFMSIVFYRAVIGLLPIFFWITRMPNVRSQVSLKALGWKYRLVLLGLGISMCGTASTYYLAILKTSVAKAVLFHYTAPIYVAILSPLILKEKNGPMTWFAVGAGLLGTGMIAEPASLLESSSAEFIGIVSGLLSGIFLSGVFIFGRFIAGHLPSQVSTLWGCFIVALILLPWGIKVPEGHLMHNLPFFLLLGTISLAAPYTLFFQAQKYISAQVASQAALFEPICGIGVGFLIFGENLTLLGSIGAVIVLLSIYVASCR